MDYKAHLANTMLVICLGLVILSCDKTNLDDLCADPIGSEGITLRDSSFFCFTESFDGCFITSISQDQIEVTAISLLDSQPGTIVDIGTINCLGNIASKPSTGYTSGVPLIVDHGYVVRLADGTFGRFYVDSFDPPTGSAVDEVNIIWQYSF